MSRSLSYTELLGVQGGFLFPLINVSVILFMLFIKSTNKVNEKYFDFFLYIALGGLFTSILTLKVYRLLRLTYYFKLIYIIALPYTLLFVTDKKLRLILTYLLIAVTGLYFLIRLSNGWHGVTPYLLYL